MKLDELLNIVSSKTGKYVNQSLLAEALGITRQTVSNRIKNESQVTVSELQRIEDYFGIICLDDSQIEQGEVIYVNYYSDVFASCGNGTILFSDERIKVPIPITLISGFSNQKSYSMINASGNSMSPTISDGDRLLVEHWNGEQIQDNRIYVFCFNQEFFIKRLSKNLDEIIIKSDNPEYRVRTINGSTINELILVGKIVGIFKTL